MIQGIHQYWRALANGDRTAIPDRLLLTLLFPFSLCYAMLQRLRESMYRAGIFKARRLPRPVISIGNLTVGGTGKTPVTAYIARLLLQRGYRVAVLSRGYGGVMEGKTALVSDGTTIMLKPKQCGDESYLLATTIPGLIVVIGADRYEAGKLALERLSPDIFLLDDGFQHLRLHRDLNLLLLDATRPFGNGMTLPAGLLREPKSAASRAVLVIRTRCPRILPSSNPLPWIPSCDAHHDLSDIIPLAGGEPVSLDALHGRKLLAFAGIADPSDFFMGLRKHGLDLVSEIYMSDHVIYDDDKILKIWEMLRATGAEFALTTEKDGVKLRNIPETLAERILLARLELTIGDPAPLKTALCNLLQN